MAIQDNEALQSQTLDRLAAGAAILSSEGHNEYTLGHLSMRDPAGNGFWLKRPDRGLDEVRGPEAFHLVDFEGRVRDGSACHSEWPIHAEIYIARPDVTTIGHTHPLHATLFSATDEEIVPLNFSSIHLMNEVARFSLTSGLINTGELGRALAVSLADKKVVLMKNHGVTFVGRSIEDAVLAGVSIERACQSQMLLASCGWAWSRAQELGGPVAQPDKSDNGSPSPEITRFFNYLERKARGQRT